MDLNPLVGTSYFDRPHRIVYVFSTDSWHGLLPSVAQVIRPNIGGYLEIEMWI